MAFNKVDVSLGSLPFTTNAIVKFSITAIVPNNAVEVLVFVCGFSGYLTEVHPNRERYFDIWTESNNQTIGMMRFFMSVYPQDAVSFNSDNFWLPIVGNNREIYVQQTKGPVDMSNSFGDVRILAWR